MLQGWQVCRRFLSSQLFLNSARLVGNFSLDLRLEISLTNFPLDHLLDFVALVLFPVAFNLLLAVLAGHGFYSFAAQSCFRVVKRLRSEFLILNVVVVRLRGHSVLNLDHLSLVAVSHVCDHVLEGEDPLTEAALSEWVIALN